MKRSWLAAVPLALALASPAAAVGFCDDTTDPIGFQFRIGVHVGEPYTEEEIATFDRMELKRRGVNATRVERWNGCLRAWVRSADGAETQQFFDPNSYDRIDLTLR